MADVTKFEDFFTGQWSLPGAENPRLAAPISATATTITFTNPLKDEDGTVVTKQTLIGIKDKNGYTESVYIPAGGLSADGLTATGCVRGIDLAGLDPTTANDSTLAVAHDQDDAVFNQISAIYFTMMQAALQGTIDSGGENWKIGNQADNDITVYAANGDANEPFWRYDSATSAWVYSNDGVSTTPFGTGAGVTGGDGITVTAGDIDVDTTDTTVFVTTSSGAGDSGKVIALDASGTISDSGFYDGNLQNIVSTGTTGITATELETLSDGSDASSLHTHRTPTMLNTQNAVLLKDDFNNTSVSGTGATSLEGSSIQLQTGSTSGGRAHCRMDWSNLSSDISGQSGITFQCAAILSSTSDVDVVMGITDNIQPTTNINGTLTVDHAAFIIDDTILYASVADGVTQQRSDISSGLTLTNLNNYYIEKTGSNYAFYVNGTLKWTSSANNPDSGLDVGGCGVRTNAAANKNLDVTAPYVTFDL